jgi:DNA-binding response OmpR family regulator
MKILVIEDEANIAQILRLYLEQAGYAVLTASDGVAGIELHAREHPDLVILDLMLPALDGMEVCRRIRAWANTPILMLTARQGEEDRIAGLELGADDYLVKPFSPREVVSRVKAILRRSSGTASARELKDAAQALHIASTDAMGNRNEMELALVAGGKSATDAAVLAQGLASRPGQEKTADEELDFGGLRIHIPARRVEVNGQKVTLTAKEFDLLVTLAKSPDRVFTRESLLDQVWGYTYLGDGRTVDVHVGTLRKKIEAVPGAPHHIKTVWGVGYKFEPEGRE